MPCGTTISYFRIPLDPISETVSCHSDVVRSPSLKDPVIVSRAQASRSRLLKKRILNPVLLRKRKSSRSHGRDPPSAAPIPAVEDASPREESTSPTSVTSPASDGGTSSDRGCNSPPPLLSPPLSPPPGGGGSPAHSNSSVGSNRKQSQGGHGEAISELVQTRLRRSRSPQPQTQAGQRSLPHGGVLPQQSSSGHSFDESDEPTSPLVALSQSQRRSRRSKRDKSGRTRREGSPPSGTREAVEDGVCFYRPPLFPCVILAASDHHSNDDGDGRTRKKRRKPGSPRKESNGLIALAPLHGARAETWRSWILESAVREKHSPQGERPNFAYPLHVGSYSLGTTGATVHSPPVPGEELWLPDRPPSKQEELAVAANEGHPYEENGETTL